MLILVNILVSQICRRTPLPKCQDLLNALASILHVLGMAPSEIMGPIQLGSLNAQLIKSASQHHQRPAPGDALEQRTPISQVLDVFAQDMYRTCFLALLAPARPLHETATLAILPRSKLQMDFGSSHEEAGVLTMVSPTAALDHRERF